MHMIVWGGGVAIAVAALAYVQLRRPDLTPELRGQRLARELGCFGCHGPGATGGTPNPGSDEKEVPAWDGGTSMMYVENEDEIREWILYGHPTRLADHDEDEALIDMLAYENVVSQKELEHLVAYYKAVAVFEPMPPDVREGYRIAGDSGCFGCHGPSGLVGTPNPRSFKGYIPPWRGKDFDDLVRDDDELEEWILEGSIERFRSNPFARFFTGRQIVRMPAYKDRLTHAELESIIAYIDWLQPSPEEE